MNEKPTLLTITELVGIVLERERLLELENTLPNFTVESVTEWCNKELVQEVWTTHENPLQGELLTLRGCILVAMTLPPTLVDDVTQAILIRFNGWSWVTKQDSVKKNGWFFDKCQVDFSLINEVTDVVNGNKPFGHIDGLGEFPIKDPLTWYEENKEELESLCAEDAGIKIFKGPGNTVTIINEVSTF